MVTRNGHYYETKGLMFVSVSILCALSLLFLSQRCDVFAASEDVDINLVLNPTISIQLSSPSDLTIPELAPGLAADSNTISVGVSTNSVYGCQLSATVGAKNGTDALVNESNSDYTFDNLTSGVSSLSLFADNTWGYSYCPATVSECTEHSDYWVYGSRGDTHSGYGGLPLDNNTDPSQKGMGGVLLINSTSSDGTYRTESVQFKIAAKSSTSQASGNYSNAVNFYAVANVAP